MSSVNQINDRIDQTVRVFDQFYNYDENVPALEYDAVRSFFRSVFKTDEAAGNFTVAIFRVAQNSGQNVMNILNTFENQSPPEITATLCYYLNGIRSPATLLGVLTPTTPNFYTARNVKQ
jgi:hypothetical protein